MISLIECMGIKFILGRLFGHLGRADTRQDEYNRREMLPCGQFISFLYKINAVEVGRQSANLGEDDTVEKHRMMCAHP